MTLLYLMRERAERNGFFLCAVTCEHGIRGKASKKDAELVKRWCERSGIPLYFFSADCKKLAKENKQSLETAAREFRRGCFQSLIDEGKADFIATAHHENDEAETVLFRLSRGASLTGVRGMAERSGCFIRPLLRTSKEEILQIAKANHIPYRDDKTNFALDATRNKLRLDVLPRLERAVPKATKSLARFARLADEDDECLYALSEKLIKKAEAEEPFDTGYRLLKSEHKPLFRRACLTILKSLGVEKDYFSAHLESVYRLQGLQTGSRIALPKGVTAVKKYDEIVFLQVGREGYEWGRYEVIAQNEEPTFKTAGRVLRADADKIPKSATVRLVREGDEFRKYGGGNKSLKKYFVDQKIARAKRRELLVLAEADGNRVYAVCGVEIAEEIKLDENTKNVVFIALRKKIEENER